MPQIDPSQVSGWCSRVVVKLDPSEKGIYVKKKKEPEAQVDIFFNQLHMCLHLSHLIRYKNKDLLCFHFKKKSFILTSSRSQKRIWDHSQIRITEGNFNSSCCSTNATRNSITTYY